jgi:hypothetical protein
VDPRTGLDDMEKGKFLALTELELRSLGLPAQLSRLLILIPEDYTLHEHDKMCYA